MNYIEKLEELEKTVIDNSEKYFCVVRKSYIPATPEEKVRQNFLKYLIEKQNFPIDRIRVEESLAHYGKGNRRIDILVLDKDNLPFFIYECKKEFEPLTDDVINQALDYFELLNTVEYLGIVIGNQLDLLKYQDSEPNLIKIEQPNIQMINSGECVHILDTEVDYKRNKWEKPVNKQTIEELKNFGIIGEGTAEEYHSFLVNLDGWLLDQKDKLKFKNKIEDIGIKFTKFGSAGGGFFAKEFRSFLLKEDEEKPIVCIALTSMLSGKNSPIRTSIYVGIETIKEKNSALQLQVGKSVTIENNKINITHNGTITIGRLGAAKRSDLLGFVEERKPTLIKNDVVYLGEFDENEEINSKNVGEFIENLIEYAILRNEFREIRKQAVANRV